MGHFLVCYSVIPENVFLHRNVYLLDRLIPNGRVKIVLLDTYAMQEVESARKRCQSAIDSLNVLTWAMAVVVFAKRAS